MLPAEVVRAVCVCVCVVCVCVCVYPLSIGNTIPQPHTGEAVALVVGSSCSLWSIHTSLLHMYHTYPIAFDVGTACTVFPLMVILEFNLMMISYF